MHLNDNVNWKIYNGQILYKQTIRYIQWKLFSTSSIENIKWLLQSLNENLLFISFILEMKNTNTLLMPHLALISMPKIPKGILIASFNSLTVFCLKASQRLSYFHVRHWFLSTHSSMRIILQEALQNCAKMAAHKNQVFIDWYKTVVFQEYLKNIES